MMRLVVSDRVYVQGNIWLKADGSCNSILFKLHDNLPILTLCPN